MTTCACVLLAVYAPRVARPLIPSKGQVFFLAGSIRPGNGELEGDRYNVRTREVVLNKKVLEADDWSTEAEL